jgi:hypothetical protein
MIFPVLVDEFFDSLYGSILQKYANSEEDHSLR